MQTTTIPPGPSEGFDLGGSDESLARMRVYFAEYGDIYRVFAPSRGVFNYVINHPDDIKRVLLSNHRNYTKGEGMDRVKILLGNGIMTSEGDFWRRQRRMMQPSFHRRIIDRFTGLIASVNDKYAERWAAKAARGEPVNVTDDTSELTLEIVLGSIFGTDLLRLEQQFGANPFEVVAKEQNRDLKFAFRFRSLAKLVGELIERRRREPEEHFDFLALLMATRDRDTDAAMSDRELIDEVLESLARWCGVRARAGFAPVRAAFLARAPADGTPLTLRLGDRILGGAFAGLAEDGSLLLREGGRVHVFAAGEVTIGNGA